MKFSVDSSKFSVGVKNFVCGVKQKIRVNNVKGQFRETLTDVIAFSMDGCEKGKGLEEKKVKFDLNEAHEVSAPKELTEKMGGRIQQGINGTLINVTYELHVYPIRDG